MLMNQLGVGLKDKLAAAMTKKAPDLTTPSEKPNSFFRTSSLPRVQSSGNRPTEQDVAIKKSSIANNDLVKSPLENGNKLTKRT